MELQRPLGATAPVPAPAHFRLLFYLTTFVESLDNRLDLRSKARQRLLTYHFTNPWPAIICVTWRSACALTP